MGVFGLIACIILLSYSSYPAKVKKLESKIKKLERNLKGEKTMSKLLAELINKKCVLVTAGGFTKTEGIVLDVDDEWIKFSSIDKKGGSTIQVIRIDSIEKVDVVEN